MNFTGVYVGYGPEIMRRYIQKEAMLFYWFEPDPLLAEYPSTKLFIPEHTDACAAAYNIDPYESGWNCTNSAALLQKIISKDVAATEKDLFKFFSSYTMTMTNINDMLKDVPKVNFQ